MAAASDPTGGPCSELIISNVPNGVTQDHLTNFLECNMLNLHVRELNFKKAGVAHVILDEPFGLAMIEETLKSNALEGRQLKVRGVDSRGAVLISRFNPSTSDNSFKYYFSNKRRSGSGSVNSIHRHDDNFVIVYFHSIKDAEAVVGRSHRLEETDLKLTLFDPNFDEMPDTEKTGVTQAAEREPPRSTQCTWESSGPSMPQSYETDAQNHTLFDQDPPQLSGYGDKSGEMAEHVYNTKPPGTKISKEIEGVNHVYCQLMDVFSDAKSQQLQGLELEVDDTEDRVKIRGEPCEVNMAAQLLSCLKENHKSKYMRDVAEKFDRWDDMFMDIQREVTEREFVLKIGEGYFGKEEMCISNSEGSFSFDNFLERYVSSKTIVIRQGSSAELLKTTAWEEFVENELYDRPIVARAENDNIELVGSVKCLDEAKHLVEQFLLNTPDEHSVVLFDKEAEFVRRFWFKGGTHIQNETGIDCVELQLDGRCYKISGNRNRVRREMNKLEKFRKTFKSRRAILIHPKLADLQHGNKELLQDFVANISKDRGCLIESLPDCQVGDLEEEQDEWGRWMAAVVHSFTLPGGKALTVHVLEGRPETVKVDAVVLCSSAASSRTMSQPYQAAGGMSSSRLEHKALIQQAEGVQVSQPGARPCKAVIRVLLAHYFPPDLHGSWEACMDNLMTDVFRVCQLHAFTSLALPLVGVDEGDSLRPIDVAATAIVEAITKQCQSTNASSVRHVFLCSRRAVCLHALASTLEDMAWFKTSPTEHSLAVLATDVPKVRSARLQSGAIEVIKADISKISVDALIVPCDIDIDLDMSKSQVTKSLMKGGDEVRNTLQHGDAFYKNIPVDVRNEELAEKRILAGKGGFLAARHIIYVFLPPWGPGAARLLIEVLHKSLKNASDKKCRSVAMAALGGGKLGYPARFVARTTMLAICDFLEQDRTVSMVKLVQFDYQTHEVYKEEYFKWMQQLAWSSNDSYPSAISYPQPLQYPHPTPSSYASAAGSGRGRGRERGEHTQGTALKHGNPNTSGQNTTCITVNGIKLRVKMGDITREKCDAVVNGINREFDFSRGGIAKAFYRTGGEFLARVCHSKDNMTEMAKSGIVIIQGPGLLNNTQIMHLDVGRFGEKPKDFILKSLIALLKKYPNCATVAFPALGTGASRFNAPEQLVDHMMTAIKELKKSKGLKEVRLVTQNDRQFKAMASRLKPADRRSDAPPAHHPHKRDQARASPPYQPSGATAASVSSPDPPTSILVTKAPASDWAKENAQTFFIFSDNEEDSRGAARDLESAVVDLLGPVKPEYHSSYDGGACDRNQGDDAGGGYGFFGVFNYLKPF